MGAGTLPQSSNSNEALARLKPHDHLCLIYQTPEEWHAAVIPFLAIGLKRGEKCLYVVDARTADQLRGFLHQAGVDVAASEASGQLVIWHEGEAYTREGSFDPDRMIGLLRAETEKAIAEGYSALRTTGEMSWALRGHSGSEKVLEYEAKLNQEFFSRHPCLAMCQYERRKFDPDTIKGVILTHPLLMVGNRVYRNIYHIPPEEYLHQEPGEREVQVWLDNLERQSHAQERIRFLADVLDRSSQPLIAAHPDGRITTWNPAFCELIGYSDEDLSTLSGLGQLTPAKWHQSEARVLKKLHSTGEPQRYVKEYVRKDGSRVPVELFVHEACDAEGNVQYYYSFITDLTESRRSAKELRRSVERLQRVLEGTVKAMALTVEMRDPYTAGHQRRVTQLACAIAQEVGLLEEQIEGIRIAGLLHDIGKICVPSEILSKPGQISEGEFSMIRTHSQVGSDILKTVEFPWPVASIVLQHHERIDGSGYPSGLGGEHILPEARILAVADVVEAMASHRPYRPALGTEEALDEISRNRGKLYDPHVVDACLKVFAERGFKFE